MDYHIGGPLNQRLIVGDKQHGLYRFENQLFQPFQRLDVNVIGRLIQKQDGGLCHEKPRHLRFYLFTAGKRTHLLVPVEEIRGQLQLSGQMGQLSGRLHPKGILPAKIFIDCLFFLLRWQFLGQIARMLSRTDPFALRLRIAFDQFGIVNPF